MRLSLTSTHLPGINFIKVAIFISMLIYASYFMFVPPNVSAQQTSLSISPPLMKALIKPGKSILIDYELKNQGDPTIATINVVPFKPSGVNGEMSLEAKNSPAIQFNLDSSEIFLGKPFFLESRQTKKIRLRVSILEEAIIGDYYYTFVIQTKNPAGREGETNLLARVNLGTNILLTVIDNAKLDVRGKIVQFDIKPRLKIGSLQIVESFDKIPVFLIVNNEGNNLFTPSGSINLLGNFGERASFPLVPQSVLANSRRKMLVNQDDPYRLSSLSTLVLSGIFVGKYQLSANVALTKGGGSLFASTSFYALPLKLTFAVILILAVLIIIFKQMSES